MYLKMRNLVVPVTAPACSAPRKLPPPRYRTVRDDHKTQNTNLQKCSSRRTRYLFWFPSPRIGLRKQGGGRPIWTRSRIPAARTCYSNRHRIDFYDDVLPTRVACIRIPPPRVGRTPPPTCIHRSLNRSRVPSRRLSRDIPGASRAHPSPAQPLSHAHVPSSCRFGL